MGDRRGEGRGVKSNSHFMRIRFLIDFLSSSPGMSTRLPLEALLKRCSIVVCCVCCTSLSSWICWARRISVTGTICNGRQGTERTHKYSVQQRHQQTQGDTGKHRETQRDTERHRERDRERESEKLASTPAATAARICILQIQLLQGRIAIAFAIEIQFKKRLQINCSFLCRLSFASDFSSFSTDFSLFAASPLLVLFLDFASFSGLILVVCSLRVLPL